MGEHENRLGDESYGDKLRRELERAASCVDPDFNSGRREIQDRIAQRAQKRRRIRHRIVTLIYWAIILTICILYFIGRI